MKLTIPWKHLASSNLRNKRRGGRGHAWAYKNALQAIELHAMDQVRGERPRYPTGNLTAWLRFYPPDRRKRDVTNLVKGLLDGLEGVVYTDDYQVQCLHVIRMGPRDEPRVEITVEAA